MKCSIPEISWHNREPILSIDVQPKEGEFYRLATGSTDSLILIWQLQLNDTGVIQVEILSELTRHQKAVNTVRWSPSGQYLASGDDDANIIVWQMKNDNIPLLENENNYKETWIVYQILRGHKEDVYDICWSPNGTKLLSGSVDNTAILWDMTKARSEYIISDHKSFVQGVAWDPKNQFIATMSNDRVCRIFEHNGRRIRARICRGSVPVDEIHALHKKEVKFFHDDTFKSFFRRLTFTPDGSFLIVPSGCIETDDDKTAMYGTFIFTLDSFNQPAAIIPTIKQCSMVAKCSPILYELRARGPKPLIDLPYRMIVAIATESDVILYDTQQNAPFAHLQNIHYTRLTDLTWSQDGLLLVVSSTDGFISLITFDKNELGVTYIKDESEPEDHLMNFSEEIQKSEEKLLEVKSKKPSFIEKWAKQSGAVKIEQKLPVNRNNEEKVIEIEDSPMKMDNSPDERNVKKTPISIYNKCTYQEMNTEKVSKRITPITLITNSPKKRINPIRIQQTASEKNAFKPIEKFFVNGVETDTKHFYVHMPKTTDEGNVLISDPMKDELPESPVLKAFNQSKISKTPKELKRSPTSIKKNETPPKVSLLKYFKPISDKTEGNNNPGMPVNTHKCNLVQPMFNKPKAIVPSTIQEEIIDICDESIDPSEDFKLFVEEDCANEEVKYEKENSVVDTNIDMLKAEIKQKRRVPLITLSSPKAKKKKL